MTFYIELAIAFLLEENVDSETAEESVQDVLLMTRLKNSDDEYELDLKAYLWEVEKSLFATFAKGIGDIGDNAQAELLPKQFGKFTEGYVAFFWKHWSALQKLPTVQKTMEVIGKANPTLCEVFKTEVRNRTKTVTSSQTPSPVHPPSPLPQKPARLPSEVA
ncbi:hypothetical protein K9L63_00005 [Candidatus Gracilibacteria bacterium]|nr:hypothetical protein [Candidatus Gracilibacteria bacterium]